VSKSKSKKQKKSSKSNNVAAEVALAISAITNQADPVDMPSADDVYRLLAAEGSQEAMSDILKDIELKLTDITQATDALHQTITSICSAAQNNYCEHLAKVWLSLANGAANISNSRFNEIKAQDAFSSASFSIPSVVPPESEIVSVQTVSVMLGPDTKLLTEILNDINLAYGKMLGKSGLVMLATIANTLRIANTSTEILNNASQELDKAKVMLELLEAKFSNLTVESEQLNEQSTVKWL
jgi:hypothetical protein